MEKTLRSFYEGSNADLGPVNMDSPPQTDDYLRWTGAYWAPASFEEPEKNLTETVRNAGFTMLPKGTPVKIVGNSGQEANVIAANATNSFPAHLVLNHDLMAGASGEAVAIGFIKNVSVPDASIFTGGQEVYLGPTGGWTTTRPTGTNKIQKLGVIVKPNTGANTISGIVDIANIQDLPNLSEGKIWIGGSDGIPQESDRVFSGQIINGTAFFVTDTKPTTRIDGGALVAGDKWYKTDDQTEWFWNGTYWVSSQLFTATIPVPGSGIREASNFTVTQQTPYPDGGPRGLIFVESIAYYCRINLQGPIDGSNFATFSYVVTTRNANVTIGSITTLEMSSFRQAHIKLVQQPFGYVPGGTEGIGGFYMDIVNTGSPGYYNGQGTINYRFWYR